MHKSDQLKIRRLALFSNMLQAHFNDLLKNAYLQTFPNSLNLFNQGERPDFLHILIDGVVELYATHEDKHTTMGVMHPVGSFILAACIKDMPYLMSARTLAPSQVILIPTSDLRAIFRRDTEFAVSVVNELAGAYRTLVRHTKDLKLRSSLERIAAYLLKQGSVSGDLDAYKLNIDKKILASYLGMTAENFSRLLKELKTYGVDVNGGYITITNKKRLIEFVHPNILIDGEDAVDQSLSLPLIKPLETN